MIAGYGLASAVRAASGQTQYFTFSALSDRFYLKRLTTVHTHIHTTTSESTMHGDSQLIRSSQGEASRSGTSQHSARTSRGSNQKPSGYES